MKKLSLMIACFGIISIAAFGGGHRNNSTPQDGTKQKAQEPKQVQKPVQVITATPQPIPVEATPATPKKEVKKAEVKPGSKPQTKAEGTPKAAPADKMEEKKK